MNRLKFTFKAWPVIATATIGLCFLTQYVAELFGVELPDQQNVEVVHQWLAHAFDSPKNFAVCASLIAQVLVLMPVAEELIFRFLLFAFPTRRLGKKSETPATEDILRPAPLGWSLAVVSSALFSAAHYIAQPFPDAAFRALFLFGIAQCWLYAKTSRIWCAMLNHFLFNTTNLILLFVVPR